MNSPRMVSNLAVSPDIDVIPAFFPVAGFGVLPIQAFVIRAQEPVLVDTGLVALREEFLEGLAAAIDPKDLRWIWLTHTDPDHVGNLVAVLERAPQARVVTTFLGLGKLGLLGIQPERVYLLNPGQHLDVGDRHLQALAPPTYDAPETTAIFDGKSRTYFTADAFGALLPSPATRAMEVPAEALREGLITWATVDAPWLQAVDPQRFRAALDRVRSLDPHTLLSCHLPPATGMTSTLLELLAEAPSATPFVGPDQAALETMMAAQPVSK